VPFCVCFSLALFVRGLSEPRYLVLSAMGFGVSLHTYPPARLFVPLFVAGLAVICRRELAKAPRWRFRAAALFLIIAVPTALYWLTPEGSARTRATVQLSPIENLRNYVTYFGPQYLFQRGDPLLRHNVIGFGELYWITAVPIVYGLWSLRRDRGYVPKMLWLWTVVYPIPAALTYAAHGHAMRSIMGAPLFALLAGCGFARIVDRVPRRSRIVVTAGAAFFLLISVSGYLREYFTTYPVYSAVAWQYGMRDAIRFANDDRYAKVVISDQFFLPHIFVLFYTQYPPTSYQRSPVPGLAQDKWHYTDYSLGKYSITSIASTRNDAGPTLYIIRGDELASFLRRDPDRVVVRRIEVAPGFVAVALVENGRTAPVPARDRS